MSHEMQCCKCRGITFWTGTNPAVEPRCQWCGSPELLAWCNDHDPQQRCWPDMATGRLEWPHVADRLT